MCSSGKDISPILKEIFPSAEMASYLAVLLLEEDEEDGYFSDLADAVSQAVQEMQPKSGAFFT